MALIEFVCTARHDRRGEPTVARRVTHACVLCPTRHRNRPARASATGTSSAPNFRRRENALRITHRQAGARAQVEHRRRG